MIFLVLTLVAVPQFVSDDVQLAQAADHVWAQLAHTCAEIAGEPCRERLERVRLSYDDALPTGHGGASRAGELRLRHALDQQQGEQLRHELAHQYLFSVCPRASPLLHEAFAMTTAGELDAWKPYATVAQALRALQSAPLDSPAARRSLARVLDDAGGWPPALRAQVRACAVDGALPVLTAQALAAPAEVADAFVIVSRHSGEVLVREGAADLAMPPGSTLKPFLFAAHPSRPELVRASDRVEWQCGVDAPVHMGGAEALWRSCNGYFLDWGAHDFGAFAPLLGGAQPVSAAEAIGLAPVIRLSPLALAQAYRALALSSPETLAALRETAVKGTLAGTAPALEAYATKTGTVRRADGSVVVGWIVVMAGDWIAVRARRNEMPRAFAAALGERLARFHPLAAQATRVQVFGLVPLAQVQLSCERLVRLSEEPTTGPKQLPLPSRGEREQSVTGEGRGEGKPVNQTFTAATISTETLCASGPFRVTINGVTRSYAGTFSRSPAPPAPAADTEREAHARRGSDLVFTTSLALYTGGVLAAEDSAIVGEPRRALASVAAHNAQHPRHGARPICDTTHCQLFQGTAPLATTLLPVAGEFLPFARGGTEPWQRTVSQQDLEARFGHVVAWQFARGAARLTIASEGSEEMRDLGCELLRAPLRLPACPDRAETKSGEVVFFGHGEGHGLGLDVERAKQSSAPAEALLQQAYAK